MNSNANGRRIEGTGNPIHRAIPQDPACFKVPVLNEVEMRRRRNVQRYAKQDKQLDPNTAKADAVYAWVYRPEMQFSVFELQQKQLQFERTDGTTQLIDLTNTNENVLGVLLNNDLRFVDLLYDIITDTNFDPLARFGGERERVFSIGAEEARVTITPGGTVRFENPDHLASNGGVEQTT